MVAVQDLYCGRERGGQDNPAQDPHGQDQRHQGNQNRAQESAHHIVTYCHAYEKGPFDIFQKVFKEQCAPDLLRADWKICTPPSPMGGGEGGRTLPMWLQRKIWKRGTTKKLERGSVVDPHPHGSAWFWSPGSASGIRILNADSRCGSGLSYVKNECWNFNY